MRRGDLWADSDSNYDAINKNSQGVYKEKNIITEVNPFLTEIRALRKRQVVEVGE